jgi:hypothetical protein
MYQNKSTISQNRKAMYYVGMGMALGGFLLFLSTFFSFAGNFGNFDDFAGRGQSMIIRSVTGMVLIMAGAVTMNVGRRGLAGSGIVLDPNQARQEMKPWNQMAGGMAQDALGQIDVVNKLSDKLSAPQQPRVKIRCKKCQALNDEADKFCGQCGGAI